MLNKKHMNKILLIIVLCSVLVYADSIEYAPPAIPVPDIFPARAQINILDFNIAETEEERYFKLEVQLIFWVGLDKDGKIIKVDEKRDSEVKTFRRLTKDIKGKAEFSLMTEQTPFQTVDFIASGKNDGKAVVEFPKFSKKTTILPGYYKVNIYITLAELGDIKNDIWNENFEFGDEEGTFVIRKRYSTTDVPVILYDGIFSVGELVNGRYKLVNILEMEFIQKTVQLIEDKEEIQKELKRVISEIEQKKGTESTLTLGRMKMYIERLMFEIKFYEKTQKELIAKYNTEIKNVKSIQDYTTKFTNVCKEQFNNLSKDIRSLYTEIYWTLKFCTPNWQPDEKYLTKIGKKAKEIIEYYEIDRLIKGGYVGSCKKGDWNREIWIARFQGRWSNAIKTIKTKFRKIFGTAMLDGKPEDAGYWGIDDTGKRTFLMPLYSTTFEAMFDFINAEKFEDFIKSATNQLAQLHANNPEEVDYPYVDADSKKPSPDPNNWEKLYKETMSIRTKLYKVYKNKYKPE
ncbi:MAG: hypothetical protein K8S87_11530 [Planctomycetes bacterium]|nr:hypothetical protein [Planctomycetota bacterium]